MKDLELVKHKGRWCIYGKKCECPIVFGRKKDLKKRLKNMEEQENGRKS